MARPVLSSGLFIVKNDRRPAPEPPGSCQCRYPLKRKYTGWIGTSGQLILERLSRRAVAMAMVMPCSIASRALKATLRVRNGSFTAVALGLFMNEARCMAGMPDVSAQSTRLRCRVPHSGGCRTGKTVRENRHRRPLSHY
jgi:hypothetical protein